ncbi:MAG: GNAT family N-acetyltransferase [Desulfobacterales bacterium]|nr:GNAT family N-acetyltransferase [Desulfobacterales bacterium]
MKNYKILEWDTNFFGFKVAQIIPPILDTEQLQAVLACLRNKSVKLAYFPSEKDMSIKFDSNIASCLVDEKTTFIIGIKNIEFTNTSIVNPYNSNILNKDLMSLAIQSGEYSRFCIDVNIPKPKFVELYTIWMERSIKKEIADEVLVIKEGSKIVGMITLGNTNGRANIGLIAVDKNFRGRHYGQELIIAAKMWSNKNGYEYCQVVTQGKNIPACNFYKKCGFYIEKIEYYYHFWL